MGDIGSRCGLENRLGSHLQEDADELSREDEAVREKKDMRMVIGKGER